MANLDGNSTRNGVKVDRVKENGQVFTPDSIVNDMLDETDKKLAESFGVDSVDKVEDYDYIDYTVLEPTCGNGNFIIRILDRKLNRVKNFTGIKRDIALLRAVASIYGIELTAENVIATKLRMMEVIEKGSTEIFELEYKAKRDFLTTGFELSDNMRKSIHYILDRNIQSGDRLQGKKYLIKKSNYIKDIWSMDISKALITDALLSNSEEERELMITQYNFTGEQVEIRECAFKDIEVTSERCIKTPGYVWYDRMYELPATEVYAETAQVADEDDEYDF